MTGMKFGSAMALCGACTVHVDGAATRSCITAIDGIRDSRATTTEAIGAPPPGAKLEVALKQVQSGHAPPNEKLYATRCWAAGDRQFERDPRAWKPLRDAGAKAKTRLIVHSDWLGTKRVRYRSQRFFARGRTVQDLPWALR